MSSADATMLMDMGFSKNKVEKALSVTGNKGVEAAMEWLLANPNYNESSAIEIDNNSDNTKESNNIKTDSQDNTTHNEGIEEVARSIKCDVCEKVFRTNLEVEFHATKSGHDKFSESSEEKRPLTEEEKKQQLLLLEEKLKQKRKEREEKEKEESFVKEKDRIRSGKEMATARKKLEELEMKKILDQKKREKEEDKMARQRVKAQIEADKAARRAKSEAQANKSNNVQAPSVPITPSVPATTATPPQQKEYKESRLQIRLTNGQVLTQTFCSKEQLSAVRLYIELNRTDGAEPFNMMTNFPKKVFSDSDFDAPLEALGLVPSAVVIVQKRKIDN